MTSIVVLSPHRDDAVFSLAISLRSWKSRVSGVTVENFFTVSDYAPRAVSGDLSTEAKSRMRTREDARALRMLDPAIRVINHELIDAPLRFGVTAPRVSGPGGLAVQESDVDGVMRTMILRPITSLTLAPLGLGGHVDHRTVRDAALRTSLPSRLAFYEELPYAMWTPEAAIREHIGLIQQATFGRYRSVIVRSSLRRAEKASLAGQYRTQITPEDGREMARFAAERRGGERIWIPVRSRLWSELVRS